MKSSKKYLIPLIIGVMVALIGVILIIKGVKVTIPQRIPMGEPGWMENAEEISHADSSKTMLIVFGSIIIVFGLLFGSAVSFAYYKSSPEQTVKDIIKEKQEVDYIKNRLKEQNIDFSEYDQQNDEKKLQECKYCGSIIPNGQTHCPGCGGPIKSNKKRG